ncbi:MAG TPA: hypothetical protein VJU16_04520 [Planctomycetota bacterium]|nr:hypothetical protein [Planctomycetota bacterium]
MTLVALVTAGVIGFSPALAQEDEMTPARAMELLQEAHRMMGKAEKLLHDGREIPEAEKREKDAADRLAQVIETARSAAGRDQQRKAPSEAKPRSTGGPAPKVYNPNRAQEPSKFKSSAAKSGSWGKLPPDVRRALLAASREELPAPFRELWLKYVESLEESR